MSTAIQFTPKHAQPFTLEQAMLLEVSILVEEIRRLQNSISHLRETQSQLHDFLNEEGEEADEDGELRKAVQENDQTIASQVERISLIKTALMNKLGKDALEHYGLDDPPNLTAPSSQVEAREVGEDEGGLHL